MTGLGAEPTHRSSTMAFIRIAPRRAVVIGAALAFLVAACTLGLLDVRRRALNSDFTVFAIAGAAFFDGRDPYAIANPQGWHYAYPPLFALAVAPLSRLSFQDQVAVWFAISVGLGLLCVAECRWIVRAIRRRDPLTAATPMPWWIAIAAALSVLLPALDSLQRGQVALAITWPLLVGLRLLLAARGWMAACLAGTVLALPIAIKLTPLLPVALLVQIGFKARRAGAATGERTGHGLAVGSGVVVGLALFLVVLPAALLGWNRNIGHLETWMRRVEASAQVGVDNNKYTFRNQSFANAVEMLARWEHPKSPLRWLSPRDPGIRDLRAEPRAPRALLGAVVWATQFVLSALVIAAAWRLAGPGRALGAAAAFGLASALSLVISPISWGHHFVILLPAVLFVPWWFWCQGRQAAARWLSAAPAALAGVHYLFIDTGWIEKPIGLSLVWAVGLLGVGMAVWCAAAAALMLATPREQEGKA